MSTCSHEQTTWHSTCHVVGGEKDDAMLGPFWNVICYERYTMEESKIA